MALARADIERTLRPLESATQLPGAAFLYPAVHAWEREHLFGGGWICAGHVDQLREPGRYVLVEAGGESVVVLHGPRAFVNACRHRGAHILTEPAGTVTKLRCPYHAWTYDLDGSLRTAAYTEGLEDFRLCDHGLHPVRVEVAAGLVFLDLSGSAPPLAEHVGDLATIIDRYRTAELRRGARHQYRVAANWKVIAQNYHECLHCPGVHPELNRLSHFLTGVQIDGAGAETTA